MAKKYVNTQYFSKAMVENGDLQKFLSTLFEQCYSDNIGDLTYYNDVHVYPCDLGAFEVEWIQDTWKSEFKSSQGFVPLDIDEYTVKDYEFPDKHYEAFTSEEEFNEALQEWLQDNPGWKKHHMMNVWVHENEEKERGFIDED